MHAFIDAAAVTLGAQRNTGHQASDTSAKNRNIHSASSVHSMRNLLHVPVVISGPEALQRIFLAPNFD
jgi:hypothetical protein